MKVLWRHKDKDWEIALGKSYKDEAHLQAFLVNNPTLIPFEDVSKDILPPRVMIREVGLPGSGSTDIVGIDEAGGITIIECKLATNPEVKRKVIGQVLEYAAYLWRQPYSFIDEKAKLRLEESLAKVMRETLEEEKLGEWNEADFIQAVTETLYTGAFRIVVAVDAVNEELRQTIEYLSEGPSRLEVFALEVTYFASEEREILVPHLYGSISLSKEKRPGKTAMRQWTAERFFNDVEVREIDTRVIGIMKELLEFSLNEASRVHWGIGREKGSFTFHHYRDNQILSFFGVYSDGKLQVNLGWLKDKLGIELVDEFWKGIIKIDGFRGLRVREDFNSWPSVFIKDAFITQEDVDMFKEIITSFRETLSIEPSFAPKEV